VVLIQVDIDHYSFCEVDVVYYIVVEVVDDYKKFVICSEYSLSFVSAAAY
jgi:hypothetical protein